MILPLDTDKSMQGTVVAVDFDKTLCDSVYPDCGDEILPVADLIRKCKEAGAVIILWSCREGEALKTALGWCAEHNIPIDYANQNDPERVEKWGNDPRKIAADYYIDDRAISTSQIYQRELMRIKKRLEAIKC